MDEAPSVVFRFSLGLSRAERGGAKADSRRKDRRQTHGSVGVTGRESQNTRRAGGQEDRRPERSVFGRVSLHAAVDGVRSGR